MQTGRGRITTRLFAYGWIGFLKSGETIEDIQSNVHCWRERERRRVVCAPTEKQSQRNRVPSLPRADWTVYIEQEREREKMQVVKRLWGAVCGWCASFRNGGECKVLETHPIEE